MEKYIESSAKTIELAIEQALNELKMDRDSVSVEILEKGKTGFLGIGAVPAKVKVTYQVPDAEPAPALSSASRSKPKKLSAKPEAPVAPVAPAQNAPKAQKNESRPAPKQEKKQAPKQEKKSQPKQDAQPKQPKQPKEAPKPIEYTPAAPGSKEEKIEQFLTGLLQHMGNDAVPHCVKSGDDTYSVELVGESLGALIGRRGETLDAIQHLTNYSINRDNDKHTRITVDAENYRAKREETLEHLAQKVAAKVLKYHRNIPLEPMNAYERHVIHAALQDTPNITTFSTGTEPNRHIVVAYNKEG